MVGYSSEMIAWFKKCYSAPIQLTLDGTNQLLVPADMNRIAFTVGISSTDAAKYLIAPYRLTGMFDSAFCLQNPTVGTVIPPWTFALWTVGPIVQNDWYVFGSAAGTLLCIQLIAPPD